MFYWNQTNISRANATRLLAPLQAALKAPHTYNEVIRLDSADAIALKFRGDVYLAQGETERALQDYDEALRLDPDDDAEAAEARARATTAQ